jgi:hypothetical protein
LYGGATPPPAFAASGRLTLHAARLEFRDPSTATRIVVESPLAADLQAFVERLDAGDPAF